MFWEILERGVGVDGMKGVQGGVGMGKEQGIEVPGEGVVFTVLPQI